MKTYLLKPNMTLTTVKINPELIKPAVRARPSPAEDRATRDIVDLLAPAPPRSSTALRLDKVTPPPAQTLPPRQPLPTPVLYPDQPSLKLGLDVHLEFIMAVAQRGHAAPQ